MAEQLQVFKCEVCGHIIYVLHQGGGTLVCCDQPMNLLEEKTADSSTEKHVPVIEATDKGVLVKVGSVPHPMKDEHYIEWIEIQSGSKACLQFLKPGEEPQAEFDGAKADGLGAREYCNVHGLWKA